ncbi:phage baseplate assembly protein V [Vibrio quintilis]|uniref:Phage-related baseplate assembly protein n=1 Tax=Vibrio quintilis TaxID=1117707 RepID=A0A1M7YV85_9VIBR|nr:phage baseplate assembly protein V [Vibrio quintilis]SHO56463.1 Phage-related baseplate assembly protein [Vibrio quintilis]
MATRLKVKIGNTSLTEADVYEFQAGYQLNSIPELTLVLRDGNLAAGSFDRTDDQQFAPGQNVSLYGGIDDTNHQIFEGIITGSRVSIDDQKQPRLILTVKGESVKLLEHPVNYISNKEIEDKTLIEKVAALSAGYKFKQGVSDISGNRIKHAQFAVWQQTPWRIIFSRMTENGAVFCPSVKGDRIVTLSSVKSQAAKETFQLHEIHHCDLFSDTQSCFKEISVTAWDSETQKAFSPVKGKSGNFKSIKESDSVLSRKPLEIRCSAPKTKAQITAIANGEMNFRMLDMYQGRLSISEQAITKVMKLALLDRLTVKGVGKDFSDNHIITGIRHHFTASEWQFVIELGLSLNRSLYAPEAYLPEMPVTTGVIAAYKTYSKLPQTMPVLIPALDSKVPLYARQTSPFASKGEGLFLPPKKGDEVMVGFIGGDASYPVILGACYNKANQPPRKYDDKNNQVGLFFAGEKLDLFIDRDRQTVNVTASNQVKLTLNEKDGITAGDSKNSLTLSKKTSLKCEDEVAIDAKSLSVKTSGKVGIKASKTEIK